MENIGKIIRKHRKLKNLTQEELGNKLFVSKQAISKWENGRSLPDLETTQKLIEILEIDSAEILGGTVQEVKKNRKQMTVLTIVFTVFAIISVVSFAFLAIRQYKQALIRSGYQEGTNPANYYALDVSMVQLLAAPEEYDGKLVRVIGVGNLEFEGNFLSLSKEDWKYHAGNSIWMELGDKATAYQEAVQYNGEYVIVEGFYDKDDCGHMGMFRGSIKDISRYELWEVYKYYDPYEMYSITENDDLTYSYKIVDKNGDVLFANDHATVEPEVEQVNTYVLGLTEQTGTGLSTNWAVYCDVENSKVSEVFQYVLLAQGDYVLYVEYENGEHSIIVQNIFDKAAYYKKHVLTNCSAVAADVVTEAKPYGGGVALVTYLTGEEYEETQLRIEFP